MLRWKTLPVPRVDTPAAWLIWRCDSSMKTVCHTALPHGICGAIIGSLFHGAPSRTGWRPREKKAESIISSDYLDEVLADFSGYIAADEAYDGPFCILFIVDNHNFRRLYYEVLDHDPDHKDIEQFFRRFKKHLDARGLSVQGITTDGSPLYPEPIKTVFGDIDHQICQFHVMQEINKQALKALTHARRQLEAKKAKCGRGRPCGKQAKRAARQNKRLAKKKKDLFKRRYLFVKHKLTAKEKRILQQITRGLPQLRHLRSIMDEVYRLFDRRCRTETALDKLATLRSRVKRFKKLGEVLKKLHSPNLEKALTFLDDSLLPSTSNAVERANRRYRKMQKSIYRVRTKVHISQRIALDMQRDLNMKHVPDTIHTLQTDRAA
jgi:hypothetical protein